MVECSSGKVGHLSKSGARRAAIAVAIKRTHDRPRVYACPDCHRWHLTSAPGHRTRLRRRVHALLYVPHPASQAEVDAWFAAHGSGRAVLGAR
jgi:hypothetical protein